jgi:hypothetical protein
MNMIHTSTRVSSFLRVAPRTGLFVWLMLFWISATAQVAGPATAPSISEPSPGALTNVLAEIAGLQAEAAARPPAQKKIDSSLLEAMREHRGTAPRTYAPRVRSGLRLLPGGRILVDINANVTDVVLTNLQQSGATIINSFPQYHSIRAEMSVESMEALAGLADIYTIKPAAVPLHNVGTATSEGDIGHQANVVRSTYGISGAGVKVGVLSDSDRYGANSQANGDLGGVTVLPGQDGLGIGTDEGEGTAMLEIVHDLAPNAQLFYATGDGGEYSMASNIISMATSYGCQVIIDDISYNDESPFHENQPISQAVKTVSDLGVLYFSSAANEGGQDSGTSGNWQGDFKASAATIPGIPGTLHDWGGGNVFNLVTNKNAGSQGVVLFWSDPWGGASSDYNLYLTDAAGHVILPGNNVQAGSPGDIPYEGISAATNGQYIVVSRVSGPARMIHVSVMRGGLAISTASATRGHNSASADNAFSVAGVVAAGRTNAFGLPGPGGFFYSLSSDGPRQIFYKTDGTAVTPGNFTSSGGRMLQKPDITAATGVIASTNTFGTNKTFTPFYGTSAAAPHAGAIAALLLSYRSDLTPAQVRAAMTNSTLTFPDLSARDQGAGIVMADAAINYLNPTVALNFPPAGAELSDASPPLILGTAASKTAAIGAVRVAFNRVSDGVWFNFVSGSWGTTNFDFTNDILVASGTSSWSAQLPALPDGNYSVQAQSVDVFNHASPWQSENFSIGPPPVVTINALTNGQPLVAFSSFAGTVQNFSPAPSVSFSIYELDINGGSGRWWNGTGFQSSPATLAASVTGTNWTSASNAALPQLNSGQSYQLTVTASNSVSSLSTTITVQAPITVLNWDPGQTPLGTAVLQNPNTNGGNYWFQINPQSPVVGVWRTALNVIAGEADVYMNQGSPPTATGYSYGSQRVGSDGFVLDASQFSAGQPWYILVNASATAQWNLVTGDAFVYHLGSLAADNSSSTNAPIGAEGMIFFDTTIPANTLAWQLWLNGPTNTVYVKKSFAPDPQSYDLIQSGQMLVVPPYLAGGTFNGTYFISVPGNPGAPVNLGSRQQPVASLPFNSFTTVTVGPADFPYVTYQVPVPVQQIAWQLNLTPSNGVANLAARLAAVPNEFRNDAYSDVGGNVGNSVTLVPPPPQSGGGVPGLSAGIYYVTVYGSGTYRCGFTNGSPAITPVSYVFSITNDAPNRVGWRFYGVSDINSQLGSFGWLLQLSNAPAGSEIAIRRNAVPGQWNYRTADDNYAFNSAGYVDLSSYLPVLEQPGHQADIWYIGVYSPTQALGNFVLSGQALPPPVPQLVVFDGVGNSASRTNQGAGVWQYFVVTVPADANLLGWDLRLTNVTAGSPQIYVSRDTLPPALAGVNYASTAWPSGAGTGGGTDWTGCGGPLLEVGMGNPLEPGTYYIGVQDTTFTSSYTIVSRGIGLTGYSIPVKPLTLTGSATNLALPVGEAAYYRVVVASNTPDWKLQLGMVAGDALLMVQKDYLPSTLSGGSYGYLYGYGGQKMNKPGDEQWAMLPDYGNGTSVTTGTYYVLVASQGQNLVNNCEGTGTTGYTLRSWIDGVTNLVGTIAYGSDASYTNTQPGGAVQFYSFTVPVNIASIQVTLENTVGSPVMTFSTGTSLVSPVYNNYYDAYGNYGGTNAQWVSGNLITIPNPTSGTYSLSVYAADDGTGTYPDASYKVDVSYPTLPQLSFSPELNNSSLTNVVSGTLADAASTFFQVTVPANVNGAPVLGWNLQLSQSSGSPAVRVRQNLLPDNTFDTTAFAAGSIVIAPPYLAPGTWYVEVKATGSTTFTLTTSVITTNTLTRSLWAMPAIGQTNTAPGLVLPEFGDTGVNPGGTNLPGDQGVDLAQGQYDFYAIMVPTNNAGLLRTELQAISGNPALYLRAGAAPTFNHNSTGGGGNPLIDRQLAGSVTEYGNWVPLDGKTATNLTPGLWVISVYASGNANVRFRLQLSCGSSMTNGLVQDLPLNGSVTYTNQQLAGGDWRYYRVQIPTNAPNNWVVNWTRSHGSAHLFVRDTVPPGDAAYNYDNYNSLPYYAVTWSSDAKNQGPYPDFAAPGSDTLTTPPLRPGSTYYLGFWSPDDATFSVGLTTNGGAINVTNVIAFYGGSVAKLIPGNGTLRYRLDVPNNATRMLCNASNSTDIVFTLEQGTVALAGGPAHWNSSGQINASLNQFLGAPNNWPWLPGYSYYLTVTNTSSAAENFIFTMGLPADLAPVAFIAPTSVTSAAPNPTVQIIWGVTNQGAATAAGGWYDTVWFSVNGVLDANSVALGYFPVNQTVPAGGSYWQTNLVTLPMNGSGNYTLFVQVDANNAIYEANLGDKVSVGVSGTFTLTPAKLGIASFSLSGKDLVVNGANGLSGATCYVLMTTNLAQPFNQWTRVATNILSASGNFTITASNSVDPHAPQRSYVLQMQ